MIENGGQMSAEFLFLFGVLIIIIMISIVFISGENELNTAMEAARNGVIEGVTTSSSAVYPENDAYAEYSDRKESLLTPYSVDIVNISYEEFGFDNGYDKKQIQFQVYAKTSDRFDSEELVSIGDRINYYLRKSIAISFNTTDSTNNLYNPVFSPHYVFTTANVKWL